MYYANAQQLSEQVLALVQRGQPRLSWFCIDMAAVDDVDFTAAATLRALHGILKEQGVRLVLVEVIAVRGELDRYGLIDLLGEDALYRTIGELVTAYRPTPTHATAR